MNQTIPFSLLGGKHLHHLVAEQDVEEELFALPVEARKIYLHNVVAGNKITAKRILSK